MQINTIQPEKCWWLKELSPMYWNPRVDLRHNEGDMRNDVVCIHESTNSNCCITWTSTKSNSETINVFQKRIEKHVVKCSDEEERCQCVTLKHIRCCWTFSSVSVCRGHICRIPDVKQHYIGNEKLWYAILWQYYWNCTSINGIKSLIDVNKNDGGHTIWNTAHVKYIT